MNRTIVAAIGIAMTLLSSGVTADNNQVRWTMSVGNPSVAVVIPITLFKDRPVPIKSERWRCYVDNALRQDAQANTYSTLTVHCSDGETTVVTSASCLIGGHLPDRLAVELIEKTSTVTSSLRAHCEG